MANTFISMMQCALWFTGEVDLHSILEVQAKRWWGGLQNHKTFGEGGGLQNHRGSKKLQYFLLGNVVILCCFSPFLAAQAPYT